MSELSDFALPVRNIIIVLPDAGVSPNTGTIVRNSPSISGLFMDDTIPYVMDNHVIFHRESAVDIELDGINYLLMNKAAVMGAL
jgi:hypothetical protein